MTRKELSKSWKTKLAKLPKGISTQEAAKLLDKPYQTTRFWINRLKRQRVDGRKIWTEKRARNGVKLKVGKIHWFDSRGRRFSFASIGRKHGVSRERVRQVAKRIGVI